MVYMSDKGKKQGFFGKFLSRKNKEKQVEQLEETQHEINENTDVLTLPWDTREKLFRKRLAEAYGLSKEDVSGFYVSQTYATSFANEELITQYDSDPTTLLKYASVIMAVGQIEKSGRSNEAWIKETISKALGSGRRYFTNEVLDILFKNPTKYIELSKQFFVAKENSKGELVY